MTRTIPFAGKIYYFHINLRFSDFPIILFPSDFSRINARVGCGRNSLTGLLRRVTADYGGRERAGGGRGAWYSAAGLEPLRWRRNSSLLRALRRKWLLFENERNTASLCISVINKRNGKSTPRVLFISKGAVRGAAAVKSPTSCVADAAEHDPLECSWESVAACSVFKIIIEFIHLLIC